MCNIHVCFHLFIHRRSRGVMADWLMVSDTPALCGHTRQGLGVPKCSATAKFAQHRGKREPPATNRQIHGTASYRKDVARLRREVELPVHPASAQHQRTSAPKRLDRARWNSRCDGEIEMGWEMRGDGMGKGHRTVC